MSFLNDYLKGKACAKDLNSYMDEYLNDDLYPTMESFLGIKKDEYAAILRDEKIADKVLYPYATKRIEELVSRLNEAARVYYSGMDELMSNFEYDSLYDELLDLESRFSYILENSPTKRVGYEVESSLKKEMHEFKALSLDKTKDRNALREWLGEKTGSLGWKLDGLTVQLTYDDGKLTKAVTRGNGEIGENVTHNAKYFEGVPNEITFLGHLVVRGEALITYDRFEKINNTLSDDKKYKNPRNLASGSVRQLDAKEAARRHINFKAFELVYAEGNPYLENPRGKNAFLDTYATRFRWLSELGFDVVEHYIVDRDTILNTIEKMEHDVKKNHFPSDGLVLSYNDVEYGKSLGTTGKFPRHSIAFKWADDTQETVLRKIEWSASRTGLINPVAIFDPVELEGTTVSRASIHNVSIMENLQPGIGDVITVYKANMIIPQIADNLTRSNTEKIPETCPVCGGKTVIKESVKDGQTVKTLYCENPSCPAKHIGKFTHFVERDRMNIAGLSEATLEKLIEQGFIKEFRDLYHLSDHKEPFVELEGQGEKSYQKLIKAIEKSRKVKLENLIAALGIANVGRDAGKKISKALNGDINKFNEKLESGDFLDIEDIGEISNQSIKEWYEKQKSAKESGNSEYFNLLLELEIEQPKSSITSDAALTGKTFVLTGDLHLYENRKTLTTKIEELGGKVSGSVSKKTSYLINNDVTSNSSKNKKAKELGISILSEEDFQKMIHE